MSVFFFEGRDGVYIGYSSSSSSIGSCGGSGIGSGSGSGIRSCSGGGSCSGSAVRT